MPAERPRPITEGLDQPVPPQFTPRWVAPLFFGLAIALVPWIAYLSYVLPAATLARHYNISWVGFDLLLLGALGRTGWLAFRRQRQVELPAVMTATLLIVDAWFDVTTAQRGWPFFEALLLALCIELPLAALCLYIAHRVERITSLPPRDW